MEANTLVLGVGQNNIGSAIDAELAVHCTVDPLTINGAHDVPTVEEMRNGGVGGHGYRYLVISCGYARIEPFAEFSESEMNKVIKANLTTPLYAIRNFLKATEDHSPEAPCCVVVIGSYGADHILSNSVPYCAAKAGINHAVKCLAWDYTSHGYRFHVVNPHSVEDTPMTSQVIREIQMTKKMDEGEAMDYWKRSLLLTKRLTRGEVAKTVKWLLLDAPTSHLSGTSIELYGGER